MNDSDGEAKLAALKNSDQVPSQPPSINIAEQISGPLILSVLLLEQATWPCVSIPIALSQEFLCPGSLVV